VRRLSSDISRKIPSYFELIVKGVAVPYFGLGILLTEKMISPDW